MVQIEEKYRFGSQIKDRREALGMTQAQLAERTGSRQSVIAAIESGKRASLRTATLAKIAEALECEPMFWLRPHRSPDQIWDQLSTLLARQIVDEASGSTALEMQLPGGSVREREFQKIKDFILKQRKSVLWQKK